MNSARWAQLTVGLLVAGAVGCNAILGIEEPVEWTSAGKGGSSSLTTSGGGGGGGGTAGSAGTVRPTPTSTGVNDSGMPVVPIYEWAQWPMPNPRISGLPNAQSYDTGSLAGVVIDLITGLQWQQAPGESSYAWTAAFGYCQTLTLAGGGWRLPTRIELVSLVDYSNPNPVIDVGAFPETPADRFWTASAFAGDPGEAWFVNFGFSDGIADKGDTTLPHRVRCVR